MKANLPNARQAPVKVFPTMSDADARAWERTAGYRMQEYEAMANAMLISMLYYLMVNEKYGAIKLRRAWEGMIRYRAEARRELRVQEGKYVLAATGKNVEDFYMREELRKKGCDVLAWEQGVTMNDQEEVSFAPWERV